MSHCVKSVRIQSFCVLYFPFPAFRMNTVRYGESLHIQLQCGKMLTIKTPNTDTFHAVSRSERKNKFVNFLTEQIFLHSKPSSNALKIP